MYNNYSIMLRSFSVVLGCEGIREIKKMSTILWFISFRGSLITLQLGGFVGYTGSSVVGSHPIIPEYRENTVAIFGMNSHLFSAY